MPIVHRFTCRACDAVLADDVREVTHAELVASEDHTWLVARGWMLPRGSSLLPEWLARVEGVHGWLAPLPRERVALHPSLARIAGCCGLSYRSLADANLVCARCGAEVGVGFEDCYRPHWAGLLERAVTCETRTVGGEDAEELALRIDAAEEWIGGLVASSLPPILDATSSPRGERVAFDDASTWAHALHVEAPSLELVAGSEAGSLGLVVRSASLAGAARSVLVPRPVVLRLVLGLEAPFGSPELPLPWQASAPEGHNVDVACDASTERVLLSVTGRRTAALVFDAPAWTLAWRALAP